MILSHPTIGSMWKKKKQKEKHEKWDAKSDMMGKQGKNIDHKKMHMFLKKFQIQVFILFYLSTSYWTMEKSTFK